MTGFFVRKNDDEEEFRSEYREDLHCKIGFDGQIFLLTETNFDFFSDRLSISAKALVNRERA